MRMSPRRFRYAREDTLMRKLRDATRRDFAFFVCLKKMLHIRAAFMQPAPRYTPLARHACAPPRTAARTGPPRTSSVKRDVH